MAKQVVTFRLRPEDFALLPGKGQRETFLESVVLRALHGEVKDFVPKEQFLEIVRKAEKLARIVASDYTTPAQKYLADGVMREAKTILGNVSSIVANTQTIDIFEKGR